MAKYIWFTIAFFSLLGATATSSIINYVVLMGIGLLGAWLIIRAEIRDSKYY